MSKRIAEDLKLKALAQIKKQTRKERDKFLRHAHGKLKMFRMKSTGSENVDSIIKKEIGKWRR